MVQVVASSGHPAEFVRWEMPLWQAMSYWHAGRVAKGDRFVWPAQKERAREYVASVRERVRKRKRTAADLMEEDGEML